MKQIDKWKSDDNCENGGEKCLYTVINLLIIIIFLSHNDHRLLENVAEPRFDMMDCCGLRSPSTKSGSDQTPHQIGLQIGSDQTCIFAFWENMFLVMTQMTRNKKSEFLQQESNL